AVWSITASTMRIDDSPEVGRLPVGVVHPSPCVAESIETSPPTTYSPLSDGHALRLGGPNWSLVVMSIPTGLHLTAQGCRTRLPWDAGPRCVPTPTGLRLCRPG